MQVTDDKEALAISVYVKFKTVVEAEEKKMFGEWAKLGYSKDQIETILRRYETSCEK